MERKYERTHAWLKFDVNLGQQSPEFWMLLGEARSKCEHICNVPLLPATADRLHRMYLIKGVVATTAIEGNTLSEEDVRKHLDGELNLPPSKEYLAREIDNLLGATNGIVNRIAAGGDSRLTPEMIRGMNRQILEGLPLDRDVVPGAIRKHSVTVGRYLGAPAEDGEYLLGRLCDWLNGPNFDPVDHPELKTVLAILKAIIAHIYIAWIHPFGDGNGRTARLLEFTILVAAGIPTAAAHLLSNHYNKTRTEYIRQLDGASRSGGDLAPFVLYALKGFIEELREQLLQMHTQHRALLWKHHSEETIGSPTSEAKERLTEIAIQLARRPGPIPLAAVRDLSAKLIAAYARMKTSKALARDLQELEKLGLVVKEPTGYRAKTEVIFAMLPVLPAISPPSGLPPTLQL